MFFIGSFNRSAITVPYRVAGYGGFDHKHHACNFVKSDTGFSLVVSQDFVTFKKFWEATLEPTR
jgi:hypothetical protein